jgi:peptidoglycan hydrolase-like protein with peptidoglycan-binding domain
VRSRRNREAFDGAGIGAVIARHPHESVGILMGAVATLTIFVNALFLQHGPHPAPLFATRPFIKKTVMAPVARPQPASVQAQTTLPPVTATAPVPVPTPARGQAQMVIDIQTALKLRGYYDGAVDGIWGAKTDAAARDFAQKAGVRIDAQPSEEFLHMLAASPAKPAAIVPAAPAPAPSRSIATVLAPSKRVLAIQRALSDFGYGQLKPTGVNDAPTRGAIEKFQRDRGLPVDGRISEDFVRALAAMSGRPLE